MRTHVLMTGLVVIVVSTFTWIYAAEPAVKIDSEFPGGNIVVTNNESNTVNVEPDLRGDKPWFYWYFEASSLRPGRVNFSFPEKVAGFKNGGIGPQGPAISLDDGMSWKWMGIENVAGNAFYYDFTKSGEKIRFAVTIPYLQSDLARFLEKLDGNPHLKESVLTKSREGRDVELLQIGEPGDDRRAMLVTCRHHAVETMASYLLEGLIEEALSDSPAGRAFRDRFVLYVVPFVDKDGVEKGDQGKNRKPHDHNRDYKPDGIYPEVRAIMQLSEELNFRYALDLHCPTLVLPDHQVMYFVGAKVHPPNNYENVKEFSQLIRRGLPESAPFGPLVWLRNEKEPSPKSSRYFGFKEGMILSATFEFPFAPKDRNMEVDHCRAYGRVMLKAWVASKFVE